MRQAVSSAWTFQWHRSTPVRLETRELSKKHWTLDVHEDVIDLEDDAGTSGGDGGGVMDLDAPPDDRPWHRAPHARVANAVELILSDWKPPVDPDPAPTRKRPRSPTTDALAMPPPPPSKRRKMAPHPLEVAADALRARFTRGANELNVYPSDERIWLDTSWDEKEERERHDYHVVQDDGTDQIVHWTSVSKIKEFFYGAFDAKAKAVQIEQKSGKPAKKTLEEWDQSRRDGTEKHRTYEAFLAWEDPWPRGVRWPPCEGFVRMLESHPTWDIVRTELTLVDLVWKIPGQADVLFRCRETGDYFLGDWKHWKRDPTEVFDDDATGEPETGRHPLTWDKPASKLQEVEVQLNFYAYILEHPRNGYNLKIKGMLVWWFDPARPALFQELVIPRIDVEAYYAAFIDPTPLPPKPPPPLRPGTLPPNVRRPVPGPTTIGKISKGTVLSQHLIWTGTAYAKNGWALPANEWGKIMRPPFQRAHTAAELLKYERLMVRNPERMVELASGALEAKKLLCWCDEGTCGCHNQVLRDYANAISTGLLVLPSPTGI